MAYEHDPPLNPGTELDLPAIEDQLSPESIRRGLSGTLGQRRQLAAWLLRVVDRETRFVLKPIAKRYRRDFRDQAGDITQSVMLTLFENDGQILRTWDPNRGMKLRSFVSLIVRRYIFRTFRGFRGNPWSSHPSAADEITAYLDDQIAQGPTLLADVEYRIQLAQILDGLNKKLSERDWRLFTKLFVDQSKPAAIGAEEGILENSVHQWRRRFVQRLGEIFGSSPAPAARERVIDHA